MPHSETFGSKLVYQLPKAFRRLPRPSSPLIAKASTMCAYSLDHITRNTLSYMSFCYISFFTCITQSSHDSCVMRLVTSRFVKEQCLKHLIHDLFLNPVSGVYSLTDRVNGAPCFIAHPYGGATRDRTADLLRARQALSQLSYSPRVGFSWVPHHP